MSAPYALVPDACRIDEPSRDFAVRAWVNVRAWDRMSLHEQALANLGALFSLHRQAPSPHWPEIRACAEEIAASRIDAILRERRECVQASGRRVFDHDFLAPFTRAVGQ